MDGLRVFLVIVLLLFIYITPDQVPNYDQIIDPDRIVNDHQRDLNVLKNSSYGDLDTRNHKWLNLTGFRENDGYSWDLLPKVQEISQHHRINSWNGQRLTDEKLPIYNDFTGDLRGHFVQIQSPEKTDHINLTTLDPTKEYSSHKFQRNITELKGEITLSINDQFISKPVTREIKADLTISTDSSPGNGWLTKLQGICLSSGSVVLSTSSSKYNSLPAIPHFLLDQNDFKNSTEVILQTVNKLWDNRDDHISESIFVTPSCEIIMWLQPVIDADLSKMLHPEKYLYDIEKELKNPEGAPIGVPPPMVFNTVIFSPDCGYILEVDSLIGVTAMFHTKLAQKMLIALILILVMQITLLKRQMEKAATPSTRSRISYQTFAITAIGDGLSLFTFLLLLLMDEATFKVVAATAFLSVIHAVMEVRFVADIWTVQVGDPARIEYDRQTRGSTNETTTTQSNNTNNTDGLPLPVTTPRIDGATPIIIPPDQDLDLQVQTISQRPSFAVVSSQAYFYLTCLIFLSLWALSWRQLIRSIYVNLLTFSYLSFWIPQIHRNIIRNCRKALSWEYVLGISILRTIPVLYWYFDERNLLYVTTNSRTGFLLLGWVILQISILASQQLLGPRLFVKESWCPPAYDYHPILQEDDIEMGGMSIGLLASASEAKDKDDKRRKIFDCAICMNEIDVPIISIYDGNRSSTWLEQKNYMVTPCRHIFHSDCLEGWMNLRLACPICREQLPAL